MEEILRKSEKTRTRQSLGGDTTCSIYCDFCGEQVIYAWIQSEDWLRFHFPCYDAYLTLQAIQD